ncbi:MAG: hypothetical protein ACRD8W_25030, partial [Nitrososphaeraceae archaeon]
MEYKDTDNKNYEFDDNGGAKVQVQKPISIIGAQQSGLKIIRHVHTFHNQILSIAPTIMQRIIPYFRLDKDMHHLGSFLFAASHLSPISFRSNKLHFMFILLPVCIKILFLINQVSNTYGVQLTASLVPTTDRGEVDWSAIRFLTIKYPPNSALAQEFSGISETIRFTMQADEDGMPQLIESFNNAMASQKNSPVRMENATLTYTGQLRGTDNQLSLSYNIQLDPTFMSNVVLSSENQTADVVDLDWRSISVTDSLTLNTPYGN